MAQKDQNRVTDPLDFGAAVDAVAGVTPPAQSSAPAAGDPGSDFGAAVDAVAGQAVAPPAASASSDLGGGSSFAHHLFADIPIAGPVLNGIVQSSLAKAMSVVKGTNFDDELAGIKARDTATDTAHPIAAGAGRFGGGALGIGALGAAAPMALGVGMETLGQSAAMSASTMGLVSSIDAAARGEDPLKAGLVGAAGGAVGPYISAFFAHGIAPRAAELLQVARQNGIQIPAGLASKNPILRMLPALPGGGGETGDIAARQLRQAVVRSIGATNGSDALTPATMTNAKSAYGPLVDQVVSRAAPDLPIQGTPFHKLIVDINDDINTPMAKGPIWQPGEQEKAQQLLEATVAPFRQGTLGGPWRITPEQYLKLTNFDSALYKWAISGRTAPNVADVAVRLKNGLDDLLEANLPKDAVSDLAQARRQWWALKTVEPLADKYRSTGGIFSPEELAPAVAANAKNYAYGGGGNLGLLGDIGATFLKGVANPAADKDILWTWAKDLALGAGAGWLHSGASTALLGGAAAGGATLAARTAGRSRLLTPILERFATPPVNPLARAAIGAAQYTGRGAAISGVQRGVEAGRGLLTNQLGAAQQPAGQ